MSLEPGQRVSWVRGSGGAYAHRTLETKVKTGFYSGCNWKSLESFNWGVGVGVDLLLLGGMHCAKQQ